VKIIGEASKTSFYYKKYKEKFPDWKLQYKIKCTSTEVELSNFLKINKIKLNHPIAIIAKEQLSGIGQNRRKWISPEGGIWLSAAYPIFDNKFLPEIFSLSIANQLCRMFYEDSIQVSLKWPNDIFFGSKKIIGFLPKVITRGDEIKYARIGIGMNLNNKTPQEGISLVKLLNKNKICEYKWTAKILKVICSAVEQNCKKKEIIQDANKFLDKKYLPSGYDPNIYSIKHIDWNGNLIMINEQNDELIKL